MNLQLINYESLGARISQQLTANGFTKETCVVLGVSDDLPTVAIGKNAQLALCALKPSMIVGAPQDELPFEVIPLSAKTLDSCRSVMIAQLSAMVWDLDAPEAWLNANKTQVSAIFVAFDATLDQTLDLSCLAALGKAFLPSKGDPGYDADKVAARVMDVDISNRKVLAVFFGLIGAKIIFSSTDYTAWSPTGSSVSTSHGGISSVHTAVATGAATLSGPNTKAANEAKKFSDNFPARQEVEAAHIAARKFHKWLNSYRDNVGAFGEDVAGTLLTDYKNALADWEKRKDSVSPADREATEQILRHMDLPMTIAVCLDAVSVNIVLTCLLVLQCALTTSHSYRKSEFGCPFPTQGEKSPIGPWFAAFCRYLVFVKTKGETFKWTDDLTATITNYQEWVDTENGNAFVSGYNLITGNNQADVHDRAPFTGMDAHPALQKK